MHNLNSFHWSGLPLFLLLGLMLLANVNLIIARFKDNRRKISKKMDYIKPLLFYIGLSMLQSGFSFFVYYGMYHTPLHFIFNVIDNYIALFFSLLPLKLATLWFVVPYVSLMTYYLIKGMLEYQKRLKAFKAKTVQTKTTDEASSFDYDSILTAPTINSVISFKSLVRKAKTTAQITKFNDEYWVVLNNAKQAKTLDNSLKNATKHKRYPLLATSNDGNTWQVLKIEDGIEEIKKNRKKD